MIDVVTARHHTKSLLCHWLYSLCCALKSFRSNFAAFSTDLMEADSGFATTQSAFYVNGVPWSCAQWTQCEWGPGITKSLAWMMPSKGKAHSLIPVLKIHLCLHFSPSLAPTFLIKHSIWFSVDWISTATLPLPSYMTLGKLLHKPSFFFF